MRNEALGCKLAHRDAFQLKMFSVILSGWKAIAEYLGCGVRTVQRWERKGLPVKRPAAGLRAHVGAHSEEIDLWIQDSASRVPRAGDNGSDLLSSLERLENYSPKSSALEKNGM